MINLTLFRLKTNIDLINDKSLRCTFSVPIYRFPQQNTDFKF